MSQAHIYLTPTDDNPLGVIGEVEGENGEPIKGIMLADVVAQVAKYPNEKNFLFHCSGPGGAVDVGDQIYSYMESLKAEGKQIDTITDGDIGSIMTKPFMAGQNRTIVDGHKLFVHAPWVPPLEGNVTQITSTLEGLISEENKLLQFYKEKTGITDVGIKGLMDGSNGNDGTFITADQAVSMKFATRKLPSKIKAFALVKTKNMSAIKTPGQYLDQLLGLVPKALEPIPAAAAPTPAPAAAPVAAALTLESDKGTLTSDAADPGALEGSNITVIDATGASIPAPDDTFTLDDGRVITTVGGKVATVTMPAAAQAPAAVAPVVPNAQELKMKALEDELAALKSQPPVAEQIATALNDFKASLTAGKAPARAYNNNGLHNSKVEPERTIHGVMAQKREDRKKQINGNKL